MSIHARPEPDPKTKPPTWPAGAAGAELLVTMQRHTSSAEQLHRELRAQLEASSRPARLRGPYRLSSTQPTLRDDVGEETASVGILNPNPVAIYLGLGGVPPRPGMGAISVPPNSLLVLPVACGDLDLGVDATDPGLAGDAIVTVLRFDSVQPAFMGAA